jgi:hypothetical protein
VAPGLASIPKLTWAFAVADGITASTLLPSPPRGRRLLPGRAGLRLIRGEAAKLAATTHWRLRAAGCLFYRDHNI